MKKIFASLLVLFFIGLTVEAQQTKNLVVDANAEIRSASGFHSIEVSGAIDLYISQGTEEAVAISASTDEIRERIRTEVRNGKLQIYFDGKGLNWRRWGNHKMKAYVTFKTLKNLEASGACNVRATETIRQPELKIEMSGASDFAGDLAIAVLKIKATGASNFKLSGSAEKMMVEASGASTIRAYDLIAEICSTEASGASNLRLTVNKELNAQASGGSTIYFKGNGLIRDFSSSGGATIKRSSSD